jgi:hypothetical protein
MSYEQHEASALDCMQGDRQAHRVSARLQAAMHYAIERELQMQVPPDFDEIADGVVNGFCGILAQCHLNATASGKDVDVFTNHILHAMLLGWTQGKHLYIGSAVSVGHLQMNPHKAGNA